MKKLLIALAAAATTAFGAFADGETVLTGTAFGVKDATLEEATKLSDVTLLGLTGDEVGFWSGIVDDIKVTPWGTETAQDQLQRFKTADLLNVNYLAVKTTFGSPLFRNVKADASAHNVATAGAIYFEGNVKFTACDEDPDFTADAYEGAKLFIYVKDLSGGDGTPTNHLFVKVGQTGTAYDCGEDKVLVDEWQKLTIKALEITEDHQLGFLINVNDKAITCTGVEQPQGLTNVAQSYADANRLFPSSITSGGAISTIEGIGFDGQGALDQIAFTQENLIPDPQFATLTFNAGTPATIDELYIWENDTQVKTFTTSPAEFEIAPDKAYYYTYKAADGFIDVTTPQSLDFSELKELPIKDADPLAAMLAINDGDAVPYSTIKAAIDKINEEGEKTAVLTLKANAPAIEIDNADATVVIDLAGCNVNATENDDAAIYVVAGSVMITNSTDEIGHVIGYDGEAAVDVDDAEIVITAGYYDGGAYPTAVTGGAFEIETNDLDEWLNDVKQDGFKFVEGEDDFAGYYVLVPDLSVTVTFADGVHCSVSAVNGKEYSTGDELSFEKGTTVTVTYKADDGCTFENGDEVTVDVEITEAGEIEAQIDAFEAVAKIGDNKFFGSFEDAYAAAVKDDTITLVADWTMTNAVLIKAGETAAKDTYISLKIEKDITIDATGYTLTGPTVELGNIYGLIIAANVKVVGGTFKHNNAESASFINVGNAANGDFGADAFSGSLTWENATYEGSTTGGNAIAAANGSAVVNSGTFNLYKGYGPKAEGDATITINGGTINATEASGALRVKDNGKITVNGGIINGVFVTTSIPLCIEIPGNSTATFDRDQSASCVTGYKTILDSATERYVVKEAKEVTIMVGTGIASVMAGTTSLVGAIKIQPTDLDTDVTLTAVETIKTPVFKIAVNGDTAAPVTSPFKLSTYITYDVIVEGAVVVFTAEEGAAPVEPVDPEEPKSYDTPAEAEAAAKAINDNPTAYINAPKDAPVDFNHADYVKNFVAVVGANNTVEVKLTAAAETALQEQVNSDVVTKIKPAELAAADGEAKLVTTPGFYYTVVAGDGIGTMAPKSCTFAAGTETEVDLPSFPGAGFYTIKVTVKPVVIE